MAWTIAMQNSAMGTLIDSGVSPLGAAGLVSRWSYGEDPSGDPAQLNTAGSGAFGIGQWLGPRITALHSFADEYDLDPNDFDTQTNFAASELNGSEGGAMNALNAAQTPQEAAAAAGQYERAGGDESWLQPQTTPQINTILQNYQNQSGDTTGSGGGGVSDSGLNSDGSPNLDDQNVDEGNPESNEQVSNDTATGNFSGAASSVDASADSGVNDITPDASTPGTDLTAAVNAQTKQLAANVKSQIQSASQIQKSNTTLDTGLVSSIESLTSNLFVRTALVMVGIIFILAGVFGLSFGGLGSAHSALRKPFKA